MDLPPYVHRLEALKAVQEEGMDVSKNSAARGRKYPKGSH